MSALIEQTPDAVEMSKRTHTQLRDHARRLGFALPKSWNKAELLSVIERLHEGEDFPEYAIVPDEQPLIEPVAPPAPAAKPTTDDEVAERMAAAKLLHERTTQEAEERKAEKKGKQRKVTAYREASTDELVRLSDAAGYALGFLRWAEQRLRKSNAGLLELLPALGEGLDSDALALGQEAMVAGYLRAHKQTKFASPLVAAYGVDQAGNVDKLLSEMAEHVPTGEDEFEPVIAVNVADVSALGLDLNVAAEPVLDEDEEEEIDAIING